MKTIVDTKKSTRRKAETVDEKFDRRVALVMEAYDKFHNYLQSDLYRLTQQWQDAENLLQDLWKHVLHHFPEEHVGKIGILRRKAYQLFVDQYRSRKRRKETITDEVPEPQTEQKSSEAFSEAEEAALKERFWSEYPDLPLSDPQKEALWLHARFGYTYQEIAEILDTPKSTIGDWISLARNLLQEELNR